MRKILLCSRLSPPLPLMLTKPVITMATDSKEAKLDERVEVTVSEGPGKQKQSEDLCEWPALKVAVQHTKCTKDYKHCLFKNCLVFHGLQKTSRVVCCLRASKMTILSIFTHPHVFKNLYEGFIWKIFFNVLFHAITMIGKTGAFIANSLIMQLDAKIFTLNFDLFAVNSDC